MGVFDSMERDAHGEAILSPYRPRWSPRPDAFTGSDMTLLLSIVSGPAGGSPEHRKFVSGAIRLGRGADNDWVLADPDRLVSRRHCLLAFRSGVWSVADVSSNGTYLNGEKRPIGPEAPRVLHTGDRLRLGSYEIEVTMASKPGTAPDVAAICEQADLDRTRVVRAPPLDRRGGSDDRTAPVP